MDITVPEIKARTRRPLAALGKLTIAALVGIALAVIYVLAAVFGGIDPMGLTFSGLPLIAAGVMLAGWRWTPALGSLVGLLLLAMIGPMAPMVLSDPGSGTFAPVLIVLVLSAVAVVLGISATVQNYRRAAADRRAPRWLAAALAGVAGLVVGAVVIGMVPRPDATTGISPDVLGQLPALAAKNFEFDQAEIRVKAGETVALRLENGDSEGHFFDVDELNVHAPIPAGKQGLALFKPTTPGTYTFYCTPHYSKETGKGMMGTLIVE
jgi:plastocyanin